MVTPPSKMASYLPGCALYFFLFVSFGSTRPFLPVIWQSNGISEEKIGLLGAIRPAVTLFAGPFICAFAEKYGIAQKVLYGLIVLFALSRSSVLFAETFMTLAAVEASSAISQSPIMGMIDSAVRHSFGASGYGLQRMWGAAGFGTATIISGIVYDNIAGGYESIVVVFFVASLLALVAALGVPVGTSGEPSNGQKSEGSCERAKKRHDHATDGETELREYRPTEGDGESPGKHMKTSTDAADGRENTKEMVPDDGPSSQSRTADQDIENGTTDTGTPEQEGNGVLSAVWLMFSTPQNASFFTAVALSGVGKGIINTFLLIWLAELGGSHVLFGVSQFVMCAMEVPFFYVSGPLIEKIGSRNVVALAQLGYLVRFANYSVLRGPWWVLPSEVLHGLTFAAMWAATTDYAHGIAPAGMRSTMQAAARGLTQGFGLSLGAILGGAIYSSLGARTCFAVSAALPSASFLLLVIPPWIKSGGGKWEELAVETELDHWESIQSQRVCQRSGFEEDVHPE